MPRKTLEYARELYRDRNELYKDLKWDEMLEKEQEFVSFCKELAKNKAMILSLPMFLKTEKKKSLEDEDVWMIGYYIILLSRDDDAFNKISACPYGGAPQMLDKQEQKDFIEKCIQMSDTVGISYLITNNNYVEYTKVIIKLLEDEEDIRDKYDYYCLLVELHQETYYTEAIEAFSKEEDKWEKDGFAKGLLSSVPLPEIWHYYQTRTAKGDYESSPTLSLYGSPSDFVYIKQCIEHSWDDSEKMVYIGTWLSWLGYVSTDTFAMYLKVLEHPDEEVRKSYFRLMMTFFVDDDPVMKDGWKIADTKSETMLSFWHSKRDYINQVLNPKVRMRYGKPFDLLEIAETIGSSNVIGHMGGVVNHLRIWTGEHFAYDDNALFAKRFEQFEAIKQWLRDNKERFPAGRWYRWGRDVTYDSATEMEEQSRNDSLL